MKLIHTVWCFAALFVACAVGLHDAGLTLITGMFLFFWTVLVAYWRGNPQVG